MRAYQEIWYDKLRANKKVRKVFKSILQDDTGCTDALTMELARHAYALCAKAKPIKKLATAIQRNTEMTDEEASEEAIRRINDMIKDEIDFKDTQDFMAENVPYPYEVGHSPTGDGTLSVDIFMIEREDRGRIRDLIHDFSEEKRTMILTHCVTPEETAMYYPVHYATYKEEENE
jgi:hypothetical protein